MKLERMCELTKPKLRESCCSERDSNSSNGAEHSFGRRNAVECCPFTRLPKELYGEILLYCCLKDTAALHQTCRLIRRCIEELLPHIHHSFDWAEENGNKGGLEFLYKLQVPVESIVLDTTAVLTQSRERKLPIGDPLQFVVNYISSQPQLLVRSVATSTTASIHDNNVVFRNRKSHLKKNLFTALRSLIVRGMYSTCDAGLLALTNFRFLNLQVLSKEIVYYFLQYLLILMFLQFYLSFPLFHRLRSSKSFYPHHNCHICR